jgi:hypothetical protein
VHADEDVEPEVLLKVPAGQRVHCSIESKYDPAGQVTAATLCWEKSSADISSTWQQLITCNEGMETKIDMDETEKPVCPAAVKTRVLNHRG